MSEDDVWKTNGDTSFKASMSAKKTSLMYGVGLQINPVEYLVIDVGYEGSSYKGEEETLSINGFNVGIGYRF